MVPEIRNPTYTLDGDIDCTINHPVFGWIPYTARDATGEEEMQVIWETLQARPDLEPFVPPTDEKIRDAWRKIAVVSRKDFCMALYASGILDLPTALETAKGNWPEQFMPAMEGLTEAKKGVALITWAALTQVIRNDPLLALLQAYLQLTDAQVDALFGYEPPALPSATDDVGAL